MIFLAYAIHLYKYTCAYVPTGTVRKASSTPFFLTEQEQQLNQVEKLKLQLQMMTNDRKKLREFLAHYNNELNNSTLYSQHLSKQTQLKEKVRMLLEDKKKLQGEQILLQESCEEAKRLCEEAHEKIYDLWTRQLQELQSHEENLQSLMKQKELFTRQRDLAVKLQHHFTVSQMRFENLQQELEQTTAQEESLLQKEMPVQKQYVPAPLQKTEKASFSAVNSRVRQISTYHQAIQPQSDPHLWLTIPREKIVSKIV
nr:outer spore wall assembly protein SHE10-like [Peromyscus maniculatus bairdii]